MPRIVTWTPTEARKELRKRLGYAKESRVRQEYKWDENERAVYSTKGQNSNPYINESFQSDVDLGVEDIDNSNSDITVSYTFKNLRFIHAQLSANPPSVVTRPTSSDQEDRKKALAADKVCRHFLRKYKLQERVDRSSNKTLLYGAGFMKTVWDSNCGDILDVDNETGELTLEGDLKITTPSTWNMFIDPDAECWEDVRYVFEKTLVPFEEALFRYGEEYRELLEANRIQVGEKGGLGSREMGHDSALADENYDAVELYEYWETGLPTNGYLGRYCVHTKNGELLTPMGPNPHRFKPPGAVNKIDAMDISDDEKEYKIKRIPEVAKLPYHIFTDIDVPDKVWGRSSVEYVAALQDTLNRLDATNLDVIQAHGLARMILPEGAEISDESLGNSTWDVTKVTGNVPPLFMEAPGPMPLVDNFRESMRLGIDDVMGVNPSMFGQQQRETSGFSMQYATNQGNMIRRRLFNKYVIFIEDIYRSLLNLVRKHWDTERIIYVVGKEHAMEAVELKGADIDGGFDLVVEYGASLSLDPMTRREEIMSLQPLFEKAGVPTRVSLEMMRLNELDGMYDILGLAKARQNEYFEEMIATGEYIPPEEFEDHENMIASALQFFMTTEFKYLEQEQKALCRQHIRDRGALAAAEAQGMTGAPAPGNVPGGSMPPGPPPAPGALPEGAEMQAEQADTEQLPPMLNE
jgi:hypothetical protein